MGAILNTTYSFKRGEETLCGWPYPEKPGQLSAYQRMKRDCKEYADAGFTALLVPPSVHGASGRYSLGYDPYDHYSLSNSAYNSPGDAGQELKDLAAETHKHGMQLYGDLVMRQMSGGIGGVYPTSQFPKTPSCFVGKPPRVRVDVVPNTDNGPDDGDIISYTHSTPPGYMWDGMIEAVQWLAKEVGFDGFRIDEAKGIHAPFVRALLNSPGLKDKFTFGEYYSGYEPEVWDWVHRQMGGRAAVLDFATKFNLGNICNNNSRAWMGQLANIGYCLTDNTNAVTWVESHDTDTQEGQQTIFNKPLAYYAISTFPGYPMYWYKDWSTDPGCYALMEHINNLVFIHEHFANGDFVPRLSDDFQVFAHERLGYAGKPGMVGFVNNDQYNAYQRTVQTSFGPYAEVHEYTGHGSVNNKWTDSYGNLTVRVPPNDNGLGYLVYAKPQ